MEPKSTPTPGLKICPSPGPGNSRQGGGNEEEGERGHPYLPAAGLAPRLAAPDRMATATSGITSILINWIKRVPSGETWSPAHP